MPNAMRQGADVNKPKILYVEDEGALRSLALEIFAECGFEAIGAEDGVDALEQLQAHPDIDVMISDIRMPRMGGPELIVNAHARKPALKAALVTAYLDEAVQFLDAYDLPVLLKPFDLERLPQLALELSARQD
jgi:DNA-binding NtrC family response regulator